MLYNTIKIDQFMIEEKQFKKLKTMLGHAIRWHDNYNFTWYIHDIIKVIIKDNMIFITDNWEDERFFKWTPEDWKSKKINKLLEERIKESLLRTDKDEKDKLLSEIQKIRDIYKEKSLRWFDTDEERINLINELNKKQKLYDNI